MKKGQVKSYVQTMTSNGLLIVKDKTRSITFVNQGATNVSLYDDVNGILLVPNSSFVLGGYDDSYRNEDIEITFAGGAGVLKIIQDKQLNEPC